jgi:chromosome segregation ATPase
MNELENKIEQLEKYIEVREQECDELQDRVDFLIDRNDEKEDRIDKAIEYINKFESIKAYYEYTDEDGYDEYNYDDDFKKDILNILKGDNK